jgi:hypothetical protein
MNVGLVYIATSPSGKYYVGQHIGTDFEKRKKTHEYNYIEFLKKKCILELKKKFNPDLDIPLIPKGFCTAFYNAFAKHGMKTFTWKVLRDNIPLDQLNEEEDKFIIEYESLVPNGYNLKLNKGNGTYCYSDETRKKMSVSSKKKVRVNLRKYRRRTAELEGLPIHVTYFEYNGCKNFRISNHPKCRSKTFGSKILSVEELKTRVLEFLKTLGPLELPLNESEVVLKPKKNPLANRKKKGVNIVRGYYEVSLGTFVAEFRHKKIKYSKTFSQGSRAENFKNAQTWIHEKKQEVFKTQFQFVEIPVPNPIPGLKLPRKLKKVKASDLSDDDQSDQ